MPGTTDNRPRVVWINVAGLSGPVFYELLDNGDLPNFGQAFRNSARVERCASVFPSATLPCQASLATGCHPGRHGILGNLWFDRFGKQPKYRNYAQNNSALDIMGLKLFGAPTAHLPPRAGPALANSDLSGSARTLYEELNLRKVRTGIVFNHISRGARDWLRPNRLDIAQFSMCQKGRLEFSHFERSTVRRAIHYLEDCRRLPRVFMVFFAGLDGHTHRHGVRAQHGYVRTVLDPLFGRLIEALREYDPPHTDILHDYTFVLTSGHGNAQAISDKHHAVASTDIAAILREHGRLPFFFETQERLKSVDCILLNHGGSMHIAVKNGETHNWYDPPNLRNDLFALGVALFDASRKPRGLIHPDWLDLILIKDNENKRYLVLKDHKVYEAEKFFLNKQYRNSYPDAPSRLCGHFAQRSADIILLSNYDQGFHFTVKNPRASIHGGLAAHDSLAAMLFSGNRINPQIIPEASITQLAPTIASLFDTNITSAQGEPLPIVSKSSLMQLFSEDLYNRPNNGSDVRIGPQGEPQPPHAADE